MATQNIMATQNVMAAGLFQLCTIAGLSTGIERQRLYSLIAHIPGDPVLSSAFLDIMSHNLPDNEFKNKVLLLYYHIN